MIFFMGSLTHVWAGIESVLDEWVEDIHRRGGEILIQATLPPSLDRELDYITDALRAGLLPASECDEGARLLQQLHRTKGFRHTLIHGSLVEIRSGATVVIEHTRVKGSKRIKARVTMAQAQLLRHYGLAHDLLRDLTAYVRREDFPQLEDELTIS